MKNLDCGCRSKIRRWQRFEVVKEIQLSNSESRIIMLTGYGNIPTAVAAIKRAIDYLAKPADADDVEKAL